MTKALVFCEVGTQLLNTKQKKVQGFWRVTSCRLERVTNVLNEKSASTFRDMLRLFHPEDGGTMFLRNFRNDIPVDTAEHVRRPEYSSTPL
jgi:hypothetical protein